MLENMSARRFEPTIEGSGILSTQGGSKSSANSWAVYANGHPPLEMNLDMLPNNNAVDRKSKVPISMVLSSMRDP
jgi:hypothetical protein